jgi:hypothetical protein
VQAKYCGQLHRHTERKKVFFRQTNTRRANYAPFDQTLGFDQKLDGRQARAIDLNLYKLH